ncbi:MAG: WD40/YVTN/BNR-like repeat-containing protein, partial [Flavobacteriales bacterium]
KSLDNGITWNKADFGIGVANIFGMGIAQSTEEIVLYGGYDTGGNQLDSGKWEHINFGDGFEVAVDPFNPNYRYVTRQNGYIHHSRDGGESYEFVASGGGSKSEWHSWFKLDPENPNLLYNSGKKVVRSSDYGDKQEVIFDVNKYNDELLTVFKLFVSEHHPGVLFLYILDESLVNPIIVKTNNCRANPEEIIWEEVPTSSREGWIMDLVVDKSNSNNFFVVYNDTSPSKKVLYFNGATYEDQNGNLSYLAAESLVFDEAHNRLYLGTNHGVYTKLKTELNWTLLVGLPGTYIKTMAINKVTNVLYVGTYGRGVWKTGLLQE